MSTRPPSSAPPPPPPPAAARPVGTAPDADVPSRATGGSRWRAVVLATAVALAFADASIVVLGLPSIYGELQTTVVQASWVITVYAVVVTLVALALGPLSSR